jgi:hypothetical protein
MVRRSSIRLTSHPAPLSRRTVHARSLQLTGIRRHTDIPINPWYVVESDSKKHARLNMMAHLLSTIDYEDVEAPEVELPAHPVRSGDYHRPPRELSTYVNDYVATLLGDKE